MAKYSLSLTLSLSLSPSLSPSLSNNLHLLPRCRRGTTAPRSFLRPHLPKDAAVVFQICDDVEMGPTADEAMMWQLSLSLSLSLSLPPSLPLQQPASPPSLPPWHNPTTPPSSALISLKMPPSCFRSVIPIILNDLFQICDDVAMGPAADVAMTWQLSPPSLSLSPTTCISSLAAATT
ncbi:uncharacterized protein LOC141720693 isoform X2 [Apium graveolens]|uniref:uncharacterized protein LOC141720693 isoform X2 n=1 Tax=Apium graveolens TaxID=4045 RepID=UPI003D79868E